MSTLRDHLHALINDERGVTALRYRRIAGRIAVVIVTAIAASRTKLHDTFTSIAAAPS
jgi:Flp pilus assembly pilin Flp